jgi:hypothetical protein
MVRGRPIGEVLDALARRIVGADRRVISVGILGALSFAFAGEGIRRQVEKFLCDQMAILIGQAHRLPAPRQVKRFDEAREQILALHDGCGNVFGHGGITRWAQSCVLHKLAP